MGNGLLAIQRQLFTEKIFSLVSNLILKPNEEAPFGLQVNQPAEDHQPQQT